MAVTTPYRRDSRGTVLEVGQKVAFNRSGDVIEGEIVGLTPSTTKIKPSEDFSRGWHISTVRNSRSILVLEQP